MARRSQEDYYRESKRIKREVLQQAERVRTILAMRKMKNGGPFKPYAIIDQYSFNASIGELKQGTPL